MISRYPAVFVLIVAAGACGREAAQRSATPQRTAAPQRTAPADASAGDTRATVLVLGTSLTAGLGLEPEQAYPVLLQHKIDSAGLPYRVVNAGVSGETSAGARRRIEWLLREPPAVLVIETGGNDGLRGLDPDSVKANVQAIIDRARALSPPPRIVLVGMQAPPNLGTRYARRFREIYPELARANGVPLVPFLLAGVAGIDSLNQADGIHPTPAGQRIVAGTVWKVLEPVLEDGRRGSGPAGQR